LLVFAAVLPLALLGQDAPGREISSWQPGLLEIHQISTGRGNSGCIYFPTARPCS
jgi:hypothetical protein